MTFDHKKKPGASVQPAAPIYRPVQRQAALEAPQYELEPAAPAAPVAATPTAAPPVPFTLTNSRSVAPSVQRAVAAPALTAGRLLATDREAAEEAQGEVKVSRIQLAVSGATLADQGLPVETAASLQRQAPPLAPTPPPTLSPVQRQLVTETAGHDVTASFTRDARYVPGAVRAEMALGAIQRAVKQGADGAALHARLEGLAKTPQDQAAVQRAVSLQRQQEERAAQAREGYALQVEHVRLQRQLAEAVQRQEEANMGTVLQRVQARQGGGEPLPVAVQRHLEAGLNADLSRVRVHHDAEADGLARSVGAKAFTTGADIYFRRGLYDPSTPEGLALTAHEATHTVQQAQGKVGPGMDPDAGLEAESQRMGDQLGRQPLKVEGPVSRATGAGVLTAAHALQRQRAPNPPAMSPTQLQKLTTEFENALKKGDLARAAKVFYQLPESKRGAIAKKLLDKYQKGQMEGRPVNRPGNMPWPYHFGTVIHNDIARYYANAHDGENVARNTLSIRTIIEKQFKHKIDEGKIKGVNLNDKPDILNIDTKHLYEIKSKNEAAKGRTQRNRYLKAFAAAGAPVLPGPMNDPGVNGMASTEGGFIVFYSPEPGLVLYERRVKQQTEPAPAERLTPENAIAAAVAVFLGALIGIATGGKGLPAPSPNAPAGATPGLLPGLPPLFPETDSM